MEVADDTLNGVFVAVAPVQFTVFLRVARLAQGLLRQVVATAMQTVVLADFQSKEFEGRLVQFRHHQHEILPVVALDAFSAGVILCERRTLQSADTLHEGHFFQLAPHRLLLSFWRIDIIEVLCVEAKRGVNEVVQLQPDDEGGGEHHDGDDILQDDEELTQQHLRAEAKVALHNVDGLVAGELI